MIFVVDETMYGPRRKPRTFFDFRIYKLYNKLINLKLGETTIENCCA